MPQYPQNTLNDAEKSSVCFACSVGRASSLPDDEALGVVESRPNSPACSRAASHRFCARIGTMNLRKTGHPRASVLECGSPLPLWSLPTARVPCESARGLAQSKTWRPLQRFMKRNTLAFAAPNLACGEARGWRNLGRGAAGPVRPGENARSTRQELS